MTTLASHSSAATLAAFEGAAALGWAGTASGALADARRCAGMPEGQLKRHALHLQRAWERPGLGVAGFMVAAVYGSVLAG